MTGSGLFSPFWGIALGIDGYRPGYRSEALSPSFLPVLEASISTACAAVRNPIRQRTKGVEETKKGSKKGEREREMDDKEVGPWRVSFCMCDAWKSLTWYRCSSFPIASRNKRTNFNSYGGSRIGPYIATFDPCTSGIFWILLHPVSAPQNVPHKPMSPRLPTTLYACSQDFQVRN